MNQLDFHDLMVSCGWKAEWSEFDGQPYCRLTKDGRHDISMHHTFFVLSTKDVYLSIHYDRISGASFTGYDDTAFLILNDGTAIDIN